MVKIDLACGSNKKTPEHIGVDIADCQGVDIVHDLNIYPWPIESDSADEIHCSHYIEHLPHDNTKSILDKSNSFEEFKELMKNSKDGFIEFFNELYRIMKPDGKATLIAPYYSSMRSFGDPTHTRYICDWSFLYLNKEWRDANKLGHYGLECNFDVKYSYHITNEMTLKSEEVRNKSFQHDLNVIDDIIVELVKK
jgi:hypothetical protein